MIGLVVLIAASLACTFSSPTPVAWSLTPTDSPVTATGPATRVFTQRTPTLQPTSAGTALPAPTKAQAGPWLVFARSQGQEVAAVQPDGNAVASVTLPSALLSASDLHDGASSTSGWLAVRVGQPGQASFSLALIHLPEGKLEQVTPLTSSEVADTIQQASPEQPSQTAQALSQPHTLAWSPDGRYLAFIAAIDGPSTDVYLLDTQNQKIQRLTRGSNQAATPLWSPDSLWVITQEVERFDADGRWKVTAVWAAATDHHETRRLYTPPSNSTGEVFLGWSTSETLVSYTRAPDAGRTVREVPLSTRYINLVYAGPFDQVAYDPASKQLAFTETLETGAELGLGPGLYLIPAYKGQPRSVLAGDWSGLSWAAAARQFMASSATTLLMTTPAGELTLFPSENRAMFSADGQWVAGWGDQPQPGVRLYQPGGQLMQTISHDPAQQLIWAPGSREFFFLSDEKLYHVAFPLLAPTLVSEGVNGGLGWVTSKP